MAEDTDIVAGTVSVTTGTKNVTGVGTFWLTDGIQPGDTFGSDGYTRARIDTVNSNTSITLKDNWRGPTLPAGSAYWIRWQGDNSRYGVLLGQVRKMLSQASVAALAALNGAPNKLTMFTDATTMGLVDYIPPQANGFDITAGRSVLVEGALAASLSRFGGYYPTAADANLNNAVAGDSGLYGTAVAGTPTIPGVSFFHVMTQAIYVGNNALHQIARAYFGTTALPYVLVRTKGVTDATWSAWASASSVAGNNANGYFIRFSDGVQICWGGGVISAAGNAVTSGVFTYPAAFVAGAVGLRSNVACVTSDPRAFMVSPGGANATSITIYCGRTAAGATVDIAVSYCSIGRWY
ncbi:hypothetical protein [Phyllobacterium sp. YR531]|uniref:hypothetical protein n=1 Tax=Phyllobacterium sp. YR531 TaxID=1144343 RepID=UPI00026FB245|nr:hypothetical protein [Phyllobacterium sp. YR531]EJN04223.1 hypothetical protein PMI41_01862 [Phyllobacterium sp. YR531]